MPRPWQPLRFCVSFLPCLVMMSGLAPALLYFFLLRLRSHGNPCAFCFSTPLSSASWQPLCFLCFFSSLVFGLTAALALFCVSLLLHLRSHGSPCAFVFLFPLVFGLSPVCIFIFCFYSPSFTPCLFAFSLSFAFVLPFALSFAAVRMPGTTKNPGHKLTRAFGKFLA
jgi:hypothetical protein